MKKVTLFILLVFSYSSSTYSQISDNNLNVKRYFFKNGHISMEKWYGNDKKLDSFKTFHKNGKIDEKFYFLHGKLHGLSYKYNNKGKKVTTWSFDNGRLLKRTDHILQFNKKDEEKIKALHKRLKELNQKIIANPNDTRSKLARVYIRGLLNNNILALKDYDWRIQRIKKIARRNKTEPNKKSLASIFDRLAWIYAHFNLEDYASHYMHKAVNFDPENYRLVFNLGVYFYTIKSYKLAQHYFSKTLKVWPDHAFTHRVLAALFSDLGDYKQAKYHIDITFPKEKHLLRLGSGGIERDIRTLRGLIVHKLGNSKDGIKNLRNAIDLNSNNSFAYRNLGVIYYDLGEYDLACQYLNKAKELEYEKKNDKDDLQVYLDFSCKKRVKEVSSEEKQLEHTKEQLPTREEKQPAYEAELKRRPFIYPNPTKGDLNVQNIAFSDFDYQVFDYTGKLVVEGIAKEKSLNISSLPSGVYVLKASKANKLETFRLVKE